MKSEALKQKNRVKRSRRIRYRIRCTGNRLRLSLHRSHKNMFAQIIDDATAKTLLSVSTLDKEIRQKIPFGGNINAAKVLGEVFAQRAKEKSISKVVLDRGAYPYHGRVRVFVEAARLGGLEF